MSSMEHGLPMARGAGVCTLHISEFGDLKKALDSIFAELRAQRALLSDQAVRCAGQCARAEQMSADLAALRQELSALKSRMAEQASVEDLEARIQVLEALRIEAHGASRAVRLLWVLASAIGGALLTGLTLWSKLGRAL